MQRMRTLHLLATTSAVAVLGWTSAALAQGATTTATGEPTIEEIVVTASKRTESIQDAPVAVSAISGDRLSELGASEFEDYFRLVPGLQAVDRGPGQKRYILRGVNNEAGTRGGAPIVQQYLDELPLTLSAVDQPDIRLYDIERVEVLRGPQGTLYGSGSMGGTVKTITRKPDLNEFGGSVEGTVSSTRYGSENFLGNAVLNVPLVQDKLAARI
ncbi:MAG TPA: TonB-dependent receptor plug domain-containing protein, partial [Polyangia bacterium]